ncbi:MAG TPA: adenylate/guanylate cyclase domain-containing protein [Saprospiraceae bacterium]|nr:adenylate/guanylate cyclase domain-containing protein [Saprospiraceae bacterium]
MKYSIVFLLAVFSLTSLSLSAQSVGELQNKLNRSTSKSEKMNLSYQIAEKLLNSNPAQAADYAHRASMLASELGEKRREADAIYLAGEAHYRRRDYANAAGRFNQAWNTARNYGIRDVALNSMQRLEDIATKQNDMREALKWSHETVNYLKSNGAGGTRTGSSTAEMRLLEARVQALESQNATLIDQLEKNSGQNQNLETVYQNQLREVQEKNLEELNKREQTISQISQEKQRSDSLSRIKTRLLDNLTKEQMADSIVRVQQERELQEQKRRVAEYELTQKINENLRNLLAMAVVVVLILAGAFYLRYRAKRRAADDLAEKNKIIEEEQKKSDSLLLNILPPAIAQELKTNNKVAARQYDQATVMFIDFTGFTGVAERLAPENLVEELDYCFSNFDRIISQYRIEKIKTVGDAYICASGLSDMNASPSDMVKAALEIQDFLLHHKAERQSHGLPYFEARVGIHTGPVVAGVVGKKKFAYDIWGDTVNIAARMEESCDPGRVNVSEATFWPSKYEFEWLHRGKIAAKNKAAMDMYYVTGIKQF